MRSRDQGQCYLLLWIQLSALPAPPFPSSERWDLVFRYDWGSFFLGAGPLPEDRHHTLVPCVMGKLFCILL